MERILSDFDLNLLSIPIPFSLKDRSDSSSTSGSSKRISCPDALNSLRKSSCPQILMIIPDLFSSQPC